MKTAIIGLAALVAGCATAGHEMPRFETAVRGNASQAPLEPLYSEEMPLPSETFSYDTAFRAESEEIVTMDPHRYTIDCGALTLIHTEVQPAHDVFYNTVLNGGCEDMLLARNEQSSQRWIDTGCEGLVDAYEEYDANGDLLMRESPAGESSSELYSARTRLLLVEDVDSIWRMRWNIPERSTIIYWWNYPFSQEEETQ